MSNQLMVYLQPFPAKGELPCHSLTLQSACTLSRYWSCIKVYVYGSVFYIFCASFSLESHPDVCIKSSIPRPPKQRPIYLGHYRVSKRCKKGNKIVNELSIRYVLAFLLLYFSRGFLVYSPPPVYVYIRNFDHQINTNAIYNMVYRAKN
jgi:hypothetical protein